MRKFFLAILFLLSFAPVSSAMYHVEGVYTGTADNGLWGALIDDNGTVNLFTISSKYFLARGVQTTANYDYSVNTRPYSPEFGYSSFRVALNTSTGSATGSWSTSAYGSGGVSGQLYSSDCASQYAGSYDFKIDGNLSRLSTYADGKVFVDVVYNGSTFTGVGFITYTGFFYGLFNNSTTFSGRILNGNIDYIWFSDNALGVRYGEKIAAGGQSCRIIPKSLTISKATIPKAGELVGFTTEIISDCSSPAVYYYYSYCPDYGTSNYNSNHWVQMGNGFQTQSSITHTFTNPGNYVVVAWVSPTPSAPDPIQMIGCTITVDP